ncbi:MAG: hypothetical protein H6735_04450 [Alphaproteobacteria bacterium]|nr:hypothetical protein [Alphaproteobacteria bacterium]
MPSEPFELKTRRGVASVATAEVVRTSRGTRYARAVAICVGGILIGAGTIIIPLVHFVAPWGIPLLSFALAAYVLTLRGRVLAVEGPCPACGETASFGDQGTLSNDPIWVLCPHCKEPLQMTPQVGD